MSIYIIEAKRTPIGEFNGQFSNLTAIDLGVECLKSIKKEHKIEELIIGCVFQAGTGQSLSKQISIKAGLFKNVECMTINKVCGSGMKSITLLYDSIKLKKIECGIAGGVESMSNTPYLLKRQNKKFGDMTLHDYILCDGLKDPYSNLLMGEITEQVITNNELTKEEHDKYTHESVLKTLDNKNYEDEISIINNIKTDEKPNKIKIEKIFSLSPIFKKNGILTPASSSSLADGASLVCLASQEYLIKNDIVPLAKIISYSSYSGEPSLFTEAPIHVVQKILSENKWTVDDIDLFEINEAFATVPLLIMKYFNINRDKININGGSLTNGHPLGSSGCKILITLIYSLKRKNLKRGIACICIGGGESIGIAIEII